MVWPTAASLKFESVAGMETEIDHKMVGRRVSGNP
jgi:hypothetical protein